MDVFRVLSIASMSFSCEVWFSMGETCCLLVSLDLAVWRGPSCSTERPLTVGLDCLSSTALSYERPL